MDEGAFFVELSECSFYHIYLFTLWLFPVQPASNSCLMYSCALGHFVVRETALFHFFFQPLCKFHKKHL